MEDLTVAERFDRRSSDYGIRVGAFSLQPELTAALVADNNILAQERDPESDLVELYTASARLRSNWSNHSLRLSTSHELERYRDNPGENNNNFQVQIDGRVDLNARTNLRGEFSQAQETLGRDAVESQLSVDRQVYDLRRMGVSLDRKYGKYTATAFFRTLEQDYDDSIINAGITNRRDNERETVGARLTHHNSEQSSYYLDVSRRSIDFTDGATANDFDRSSQSTRIALGATFPLSGVISGYAELGLEDKDYRESLLEDRRDLYTNIGITWKVTRLTNVTAGFSRSLQNTALNDTPGSEQDQLSVVVDHELLRTLRLSAGLYYREDTFESIDRRERNFDYELSAHYLLGRDAIVDVFHRSEQRRSLGAQSGRNLDGDTVGIRLKLRR